MEAKFYNDNLSLVKDIKKLNPKVKIYKWKDRCGPQDVIYCNIPASELKLPQGFYYNEKNGITNKHNTEGAYNSLGCKPVKNLNLKDDLVKRGIVEIKFKMSKTLAQKIKDALKREKNTEKEIEQ